jgi:hypothetical protein
MRDVMVCDAMLRDVMYDCDGVVCDVCDVL